MNEHTSNEARARLLKELNILDTEFEKDYDDITWLAAQICDMPISLISLLDDKRQWFKSNYGLSLRETPIEYSFCKNACDETLNKDGDIYMVQDARNHTLFRNNLLVTGEPNIVFYAGAPVTVGASGKIGTICVIDNQPRELSSFQQKSLEILANQLGNLLELRLHR